MACNLLNIFNFSPVTLVTFSTEVHNLVSSLTLLIAVNDNESSKITPLPLLPVVNVCKNYRDGGKNRQSLYN